jgi:hypothetical protein
MSKYPQGKYDRHPLNAPGPFYVEDGQCIHCLGPRDHAPDLIGFFEEPPGLRGCSHCYIKKQPATPDDIERIVAAMVASLCSGLRYCGDEPKVLEALRRAGQSSRCDELSDDVDSPSASSFRPSA